MSVIFNYAIGNILVYGFDSYPNYLNKVVLTFGILANVTLLGYYKYTDFFIQNYNFLFQQSHALKNIILPIGISFFTFQLIAYLVDSSKGDTKGYTIIDYLLFITFFPQLIVGPIVHHKDVVPQYENVKNRKIDWDNLSVGLFLFFLGCFKKLVIADSITPMASLAFENTDQLSMIDAWTGSLGYTISYYFDLSGYADMAIGLGLMFNIKIPINFNSPYKARNFADYWRRWHITLSKFLGDYIFRPIKKKNGTPFNFYFAIFITFLVSGFWHGSGWTFIVWGIINGLFVIMSHMMTRANKELPYLLAWFLTFMGIVLTRVFFVSDSFDEVGNVLSAAIDISSFHLSNNEFSSYDQLLWIIGGGVLAVFFPNSNEIRAKMRPNILYFFYLVVLFITSMYFIDKVGDFLYFQF
ncbi:MAG: MBOAT family protein [Reichenbachiella sp.]